MKKPTNMDKYTTNRYWQLRRGYIQFSDSDKGIKQFASRAYRRKINIQLKQSITNNKKDIYVPDELNTYDLHDSPWVGYGSNNLATNGIHSCIPDPSWAELKRMPKWLRARTFKNLTAKYTWHRYGQIGTKLNPI